MSDVDGLKRVAAERAVAMVEDGMKLGLGTGSTAAHVLQALAARRRKGELSDIVGVPTSRRTGEAARELGIPVASLDDHPHLDLDIDGADEVDPDLELIKGLGGALLWEKIVASAAERVIIVVDPTKLVARMGLRAPLPVEVVPFGWRTHLSAFRALGADPRLRTEDDGTPYVTDGGHYIVDCAFHDGIDSPRRLERGLLSRAGVVDTGLFVGFADVVVVGREDGAEVRERRAVRHSGATTGRGTGRVEAPAGKHGP